MFSPDKLKLEKLSVKSLSTSRASLVDEKGDDLNSTLLRSLQCTVTFCDQYLYPPIKQCRSGHCLCFKCSESQHRVCPECGIPVIELRNRALETIATKVLTTCKYRSEGCFILKPFEYNMVVHEQQCQFRPYKCFAGKCKWSGPAHNILAHTESMHKERVFLGSEKVLNIKKIENRDDMDMMFLFLFGVDIFWVKFIYKKADTSFFGAVQYIGQSDVASKYKYCFSIKASSNVSERCYTYTRRTHTDIMDFELIFKSRDCFWAPINIAKYFAEDGVLSMKLNIGYSDHH